jgi:hypothetical protein
LGFSQQLLKKIQKWKLCTNWTFIKAIESSAKAPYLTRQFIELAKSQTGQLYFNPVSIKFKSIEQEIDDLFNSTAAVKTYR